MMSRVHIAITRRVKEGRESDFDQRLQRFAQDSLQREGMAGVHLLRPPANAPTREFGILRSFESEEAAEHFYASKLFRDFSADIADMVEGDPVYRRLSGLEAFFRDGSKTMPPRWKMACVTFLGVFPSVLLWSNVLPILLDGLPYLLIAAIVNASVVVTLTWGVMPLLTKVFHRWLHVAPAVTDLPHDQNKE